MGVAARRRVERRAQQPQRQPRGRRVGPSRARGRRPLRAPQRPAARRSRRRPHQRRGAIAVRAPPPARLRIRAVRSTAADRRRGDAVVRAPRRRGHAGIHGRPGRRGGAVADSGAAQPSRGGAGWDRRAAGAGRAASPPDEPRSDIRTSRWSAPEETASPCPVPAGDIPGADPLGVEPRRFPAAMAGGGPAPVAPRRPSAGRVPAADPAGIGPRASPPGGLHRGGPAGGIAGAVPSGAPANAAAGGTSGAL